ncbi:MAG: peptide-methionine (S)-S-oxide reductase MsrA [Methanobacteriaceae archaeon]|nr:peptide-methionine (S)-S-oxide reductase MsrA [Methanobacteriaceae archaeon]MDP2835720.1 peptide-methionine (S)-S-oxide reductase MsrA [Methanobacteriaceae archaeon]MDP3033753.1 peptide-methionine (S)-S-oxide reductase MsrA [Methanobacteriaceae archaeon]MDP3484021.1 peptide-methionine (S)-S-oxide reductase MsrA [Methanobacteriaceae archaeon]MDP3624533.1 peptide-methionine (S)-S-oxide reductase MsrA [Methanobacteriaceae archaeon]
MKDLKSEFDPSGENLERATFGAGCFWGVEETFRKLNGVKSTAVGYMGGITENPTYEEVCQKNTHHVEVVEILYNTQEISYQDLLDIFWVSHDPTTLNRQGPDIGDQYRSVIFYQNSKQKIEAEESKEKMQSSGQFGKKIVTIIEPAKTFYMAEDYHQQYLKKRGLKSCGFF